jgi:TRAP-type uncharacterized transport system substrate-binding protein
MPLRYLQWNSRSKNQDRVGGIRRLNAAVVASGVLFLLSIIGWALFFDHMPKRLTIATGGDEGAYHEAGICLAALMEAFDGNGLEVEPQTTDGTGENLQLLREKQVDFAFIQDGVGDLPRGVSLVSPVFSEQVFVLARHDGEVADSTYERLADSESIFAGTSESGMRKSAEEVLRHYGINPDRTRFTASEEDADVLILTASMYSPLFERHMRSGSYEILPLDAPALAARHSHYYESTVPKAFFGYAEDETPIPPSDVSTIETTAFLAVREGISNIAVERVLESFYAESCPTTQPRVMSFDEAKMRIDQRPFHPAAASYFDPFDPGPIASWIEALAGSYDLIFACFAGSFFLWTVRQRRIEQRAISAMHQARHELDKFLSRTIKIERDLSKTNDPERLETLLAMVTEIKLDALTELTHSELRRDRSFSIFLAQCANLIGRIQRKLIICEEERKGD